MTEFNDEKYFIPDPSEIFFKGYECQIKTPGEFNVLINAPTEVLDKWVRTGEDTNFAHCIIGKTYKDVLDLRNDSAKVTYPHHSLLRVPYLTDEQVVKEGWKPSKLGVPGIFTKFDYRLHRYPNYIITLRSTGEILYHGECKDINTLRYLSKLLKIQP